MPPKSKRISRDTWLQTGLMLLKTEGPTALTVDRLCKEVDRSKGSFYFHFGSIDPYKETLLLYWEAQHTQMVEDYVASQPNPQAQRIAVPIIAAELDDGVERAIRVWAHTEPPARQLIARVDARRIGFVAQLIAKTDGLELSEARELATIEYAAFLGFQHLMSGSTAEQRQSMFQRVLRLISPNNSKDN